MRAKAQKRIRFFRDRVLTRRLRLGVAWLAIALFAFVPVVDALCALEESPAVAVAPAAPAPDNHSHTGDACCAALSAEIVQSAKHPTLDDRAVAPILSVAFIDVPALHMPPSARAALATPPPEPVLRRVPRLLM